MASKSKGGRGSRLRRKLKRKEERKKAKAFRYAESMRREGKVVTVATDGSGEKKRKVNNPKGDPRIAARQERARIRQAFRDALSNLDQIRRLDARLGVGVGAVKERNRLS